MLRSALISACTVACFCSLAAAAQPAAYIFHAAGDVQIVGPESKARKAAVFGCVYPAERVVLGRDSSLSLRFCDDGHREQLKSAGEWTAEPGGLSPRDNVVVLPTASDQAAALRTAMRQLPHPAEVGGRLGGVTVARAGDPAGPAVSPIDAEIVFTKEPKLSWPAKENVRRYRVFINSQGRQVWSVTLAETTVVVPADILAAGNRYDWQVAEARPGSDVIAKASFTVAFPSQQEQAEMLQRLANEGADARAFAALSCEAHRFYSLATKLYHQLAEETDNPVFHAALAELHARAGRDAEAKTAREKAEAQGFVFTRPGEAAPTP